MSAYGKYQNAYKRASVNTMDQNKLIVMLYDGAIKNINFAIEQMRAGNVEKTHTHLVKSKNIVAELMASLNMEKGGEVAKNLRALYSYMFGQLIEANMKKDPQPALLVKRLLMELREAWVSIGKKGAAGQAQQPVAPQAAPQQTARPALRPAQPAARRPTADNGGALTPDGQRRINLRS
jgi:flagellar protein FliS